MKWRLIWYNNSIIGYTNSQYEAEILCEFNDNMKWTIPKKNIQIFIINTIIKISL